MVDLITEHITTWTGAKIPKANGGRGRGRGANGQSPHGIKKLRELILELAVRGNLVPQDTDDEPASVLLDKIEKEKARLIKEGKIKKSKPLPKITEDEKPFELPTGWEWVRMGEVVDIVRGITFPASEKSKTPENGRVACLRTSNVQDRIEWDDLLYIREKFVNREDQFIQCSDIVMSMANSRELVGKVALVDKEPLARTSFGGFLGVLRPRILNPRYLMALLRVPSNKNVLIESASQTTNIANISLGKLNPLLLALPPLAEQHRIVAKVDELMALCDKLEQQQTDSNDTHQTLVETLLATLTTVADQAEFALSWQRIVGHFDTLFTTEESIDQLKQTILQLAVMGKLVPQDPNDEPASALLEKIAKEKTKLIKEGKIKKQKPLPAINEEEVPFALPQGWAWARLGGTGLGTTGKTPPTGNQEYYAGDIPFLGPGQITPEGKITESDKGLTEEGCEYSAIAEEGDILMVCIGGSIGKSAIARSKFSFNQQINCIRPLFIDSTYLNSAINTPHFQTSILDAATGSATPIINRSKWEELLISLPPLAEQHRIVAKVDELLALCDTLKERLHNAQITQVQLADAIVEQAVA